VHRLEETQQEARTESGSCAAQGAAVAQQPDRREQEGLRRDLRRAVTRERDLRHRDREGCRCRERGERMPEQPRREKVEDQEGNPPDDGDREEHPPIAAGVMGLGENRREHVGHVELEVRTARLHAG
jgi:hypothetical protein